MGQSKEQYVVSLTKPFREDMRQKVAIAIANDLKSDAAKMEKLLARGGRVSRPMSGFKADKLRKIFQRYNVAVAVYEVLEDGSLLSEDGTPVPDAQSPSQSSQSPAKTPSRPQAPVTEPAPAAQQPQEKPAQDKAFDVSSMHAGTSTNAPHDTTQQPSAKADFSAFQLTPASDTADTSPAASSEGEDDVHAQPPQPRPEPAQDFSLTPSPEVKPWLQAERRGTPEHSTTADSDATASETTTSSDAGSDAGVDKPWMEKNASKHHDVAPAEDEQARQPSASRHAAQADDNATFSRGETTRSSRSSSAKQPQQANQDIPLGRSGKPLGRYGSSSSIQDFNRVPDDITSGTAADTFQKEVRSHQPQGYQRGHGRGYEQGYDSYDSVQHDASQQDASHYDDAQYNATYQDSRYADASHYDDVEVVPARASLPDIIGTARQKIKGMKRFGIPMTFLAWLVMIIVGFFSLGNLNGLSDTINADTPIVLVLPRLVGTFFFPLVIGFLINNVLLQLGWQTIALKHWWGERGAFSDFLRFDGTFWQYTLYQVLWTLAGLLVARIFLGAFFYALPVSLVTPEHRGVTIISGFIAFIAMISLYYVTVVSVYASHHIIYKQYNAIPAFKQGFMQGFRNKKLRELYGLLVVAFIVVTIVAATAKAASSFIGDIVSLAFSIATFWLLPWFYITIAGIYLQDNT